MSKRARAATALTAATVLAVTAQLVAAADSAAPPRWRACGLGKQCTTVEVPLDYDEPAGATISVSVIKTPATDQAGKIGPLFVNPGGPGIAVTSGIHYDGLVNALGPEIRKRFDIIAVDPRGVGQTEPFRCAAAPGVPPVEPISDFWPSPEQYDQWFARDEYVRTSCAATAPAILHHMSSSDSARDLDAVRAALGEERISYYGSSFGSYLGTLYAAMFPDRVRAIALDGIADPTRLAGGDQSTEYVSAAEESVSSALERCDQVGAPRCALAGGDQQTARARWERVADSLWHDPIVLPFLTLDGKTFQGLTQNAMAFHQLSGIPLIPTFEWLTMITSAIDAWRFGADTPADDGLVEQISAPLRQLLDATESSQEDVVTDGTRAIQCVDAPFPTDQQSWLNLVADAERISPRFGGFGTWALSSCVGWPGSAEDSYRGPFTLNLATPPLLSNPTHDAATPLSSAHAAQRLYTGSRLVEVDTWGHTALGKSTTCLTPITDAYLVNLTLPEDDVTCQPDHQLFG
jgi:pimeloyl-ACP methyl ester carboxylesterase